MARILVIDDDPAICRLVARTLAGSGHDVIEANDGEEGLNLFRAKSPDLVVTDIMMPKQEGIMTIIEMRREAPSVAIIAISGNGQGYGPNYLEFARKLGADAMLPKPFRPAELKALVNKVLSGEHDGTGRRLHGPHVPTVE
jgi:DNA-binding response OmpR family regulator